MISREVGVPLGGFSLVYVVVVLDLCLGLGGDLLVGFAGDLWLIFTGYFSLFVSFF